MIMKGRYILDYLDENNFKKLERSLKKYNMVAYKKLMFDFYPKLRSGEFVGELVSINKHEQTETYDLKLPTDSLFVKVYGEVKLNYVPGNGFAKEDEQKLKNAVIEQLGESNFEFHFNVISSSDIIYTSRGKFNYIVNKINK